MAEIRQLISAIKGSHFVPIDSSRDTPLCGVTQAILLPTLLLCVSFILYILLILSNERLCLSVWVCG